MKDTEVGVLAINKVCNALLANDFEKCREIIKNEYPHKKPLKSRKSFTKKEQIKIFIRDGFIDRYSGDKLIFPGVLCVLSHLLPDVFPYQTNWKTDECHQAWWNLFPSIDHIVPLAFGGTNDEENLVCTSMKKNLAKSTSTLEEIGWEIYPAGNLQDWDGLFSWFMNYVEKNPELLQNNDIKNWYKAGQSVNLNS